MTKDEFYKALGPIEVPRGLGLGIPELTECNMRKAADRSRHFLWLSGFFSGLAVGFVILAIYAISTLITLKGF